MERKNDRILVEWCLKKFFLNLCLSVDYLLNLPVFIIIFKNINFFLNPDRSSGDNRLFIYLTMHTIKITKEVQTW